MRHVWVVLVNGRINSLWEELPDAEAHREKLREVNGSQLGVRIQKYEVRRGVSA